MRQDAFSKCHPAVNLLFFVGAVVFSVLFWHPAYLIAGLPAAMIYYFLLNGRKGFKLLLGLIPLFLFITFINPIINTRGETVLFSMLGRPYTLEALIYGMAVAFVFISMTLWMGCWSKVLTGDKFTSLFGNVIPSLSLLLVMIFRLIPELVRKAGQITGARASIGKAGDNAAGLKSKLISGVTVMGVLTSWALEGSMVTADSMRARGYATAKRTSFKLCRMTLSDVILSAVMTVLISTVIIFAYKGGMYAEFLPIPDFASVTGINMIGFIAYIFYLFIPTLLHIKEAIQWNISGFRI